MINVTTFKQFGHQDHGWLNACHHFSFAEYHDPNRMGFGPLRVWNDDHIKAGTGFPLHAHKDMEIITYVRRGAVSHEDNLGNKGRTAAGQVQVMSAGTGIRHAEFNLEDEELDLFQIWVQPNKAGHKPRWDTKNFDRDHTSNGFVTLVSGRDAKPHPGTLYINQDAAFMAAIMEAGEEEIIKIEPGRQAYLVPARGSIEVNGVKIPERGSAEIIGETQLNVKALQDAEVVVFDLP